MVHWVGTSAMLRLAAEVGVGDSGERHVEQKFEELFHWVLSVDDSRALGTCQIQGRWREAECRVPLVHRRFKAPRTEVRGPATCHRHARRHAPQRAQRHGDNHAHNHCAVLEGLNSHCRGFGVAQSFGGPLGGHAESDGLDDAEGVHGPAARAWVSAISGVWSGLGYRVRARFRACLVALLSKNRWVDSGDPSTQLHDRHGRPWCREAERVGRRYQE